MAIRDDLIRAAYTLFYQHGLHAVGLDQIIEKAGVAKTTLYNHFESKEDLILAVLKWRDAEWPGDLRAVLRKRAGDQPRAQLLAFFDVLDEVWGTSGYSGCLFIAASSEFPQPHHPINAVVRSHVEKVRTALRELAGFAGAREPEELGNSLGLLVAGAYALSQLGDPKEAAKTGKRMAGQLMDAYLPAKT